MILRRLLTVSAACAVATAVTFASVPAFADDAGATDPAGSASTSPAEPGAGETGAGLAADPVAVAGLVAPAVVQPQGALAAVNGAFVWQESAQGTVALTAADGGTWTIDGAAGTTGAPVPLADGTHTVTFTADADHLIDSADVPAGGALVGNTVTFTIALTTGANGGAAKVTAATAPTVSGTAQVGKALTANVGTVTPPAAQVSYQWLLAGTPISGATAKNFTPSSSSYVGKKLSVKVTAALQGYTSYAATSPQTAAVKSGVLSAPTPTISGTARVGAKLTANPGSWTSGVTRKYQWYANGRALAGHTGPALTLGTAEYGKTVSVKVIGTKSGYTSATRTSKATGTIARGILTGSTPTITASSSTGGHPLVGATLTANPGSWTSGTTRHYQWYAGSSAIKGATGPAYKIPASLANRSFYVRVTGSKLDYNNLSRTSARTSAAYNPNSASAKSAVADATGYETYLGNIFSRAELIAQLEFEGFSAIDATYAVDSLHIDWYAAAANSAASYMAYIGGFSYSSLVDQLEYDGFTAAQAAFGATSVGL